jgi:uncharacterized protein YkwD
MTRHRRIGRVGPVGIATIVAAVLVVLGIGAVVVPAILSGGTSTKPPSRAGGPPVAASGMPTDGPATDATPTAGPTTSARPSRTPKVNVGRYEDTVIDLVNDERQKAGCERVRNDGHLHDAARKHSVDMATHNAMSHTGSDRSSPSERMRDAGYRNPLSENVAFGHQTPQDVIDGWMRSSGHRGNILNCHAKAIGVGLAYSRDGAPYWTQDFGR